MGADDRMIGRFLVAQALGNAVLGGLVGVSLAVILSQVISTARAPALLSWDVAILSVAIIAVVCLAAAWLPYWRIRSIDPASVLRS